MASKPSNWTKHIPTAKRPNLVVAVLLAISLGAGLFAWKYNHREQDISPYLKAIPNSDVLENHGKSETSLRTTDSGWRVDYHLRPGFAFPFAGMDLVLDSTLPREMRDFGKYQRLKVRFRHLHNGSQQLRFYIISTRQHQGEALLTPNEAQFRPYPEWEEHDLNFEVLQIPSWFIAQKDIGIKEQRVQLEKVKSIRFETPDLFSETDSGTMEVSKVVLEGQIVSPAYLLLGIQILWLAWGVAFLFSGWRSWRRRAIDAAGRADQAEEVVPRIKTEFLATMSHEIRTPLNGVIVPAQLLHDSDLSPQQRGHVHTILESGNHLAEILQDSLDSFKIESGKMELEQAPFSVVRAVEAVRRLFEPKAAEKGLGFRIQLDRELPSAIVGDSLRLRQILINLVSNGLKFTERGEILLAVSLVGNPTNPGTCRIQFLVRDTGIGMAPGTSGKLFQKFTQLDSSMSRKFGGTGLGLSIAQGLAEMMGGHIEAESTLGQGSSFSFSIPFTETQAVSEAGTDLFRAFAGKAIHVLVVDDNRVNVRVAKAALEKLGCEVHTAPGGREALGELESRSFDLVLMDCHMPEMDGFEASLAIRAWTNDDDPARREASCIPIVALTADVLPDIRERCLAAKMDSVIPKPFRQEQLAAEIEKWARGRHLEGSGDGHI